MVWVNYFPKDLTKVDYSAAYAVRYLAKNVTKAGWVEKCLRRSRAIRISF